MKNQTVLILKSFKKSKARFMDSLALLKKNLKKLGIEAKISSLENLEFYLSKDKSEVFLDGINLLDFNFKCVYFRIVNEKYKDVSFVLSRFLKKYNLNFFDTFLAKTNDSNKLVQMFLLSLNHILIPKTFFSLKYDRKKISNASSFIGFPMIVKVVNKDRGEGVFMAKSKKELNSMIRNLPKEKLILQEYIDNDFDYRLLVLGRKVRVAEKRTRTRKGEFRNNVSLGGKEQFLSLKLIPKKIKYTSARAARILDMQVAGVDIVTSRDGRNYVLEVNFSPQFTLEQKISNEITELANFLSAHR